MQVMNKRQKLWFRIIIWTVLITMVLSGLLMGLGSLALV